LRSKEGKLAVNFKFSLEQGEIAREQRHGLDGDWCREIMTHSGAMETLLQEAWLVAQTDVSVLIRGASGTGKELLARAIHRASSRRHYPLVPVNCAAMPERLLESDRYTAARGGTLFLDEIGDMPRPFQAKLLHALREREYPHETSNPANPVEVRIISATNRDLEDAVRRGAFRADLYYRLNVVTLEVPPLSERRQDIRLLAQHFLRQRDAGLQFSPEAMELLLAADWPGNVRQLRNVVEQCALMTTGPAVSAGHIERALRIKGRPAQSFRKARDQFELDYLTRLLESTAGNVAMAARLAERNRTEFYSLLHKHGLQPDRFREAPEVADTTMAGS
jgi:two-component system response regulator GlrR